MGNDLETPRSRKPHALSIIARRLQGLAQGGRRIPEAGPGWRGISGLELVRDPGFWWLGPNGEQIINVEVFRYRFSKAINLWPRKNGSNKMSKCLRCGYCCMSELCTIGQMIYDDKVSAPCPALLEENNQYLCAFVRIEEISGLERLIAKTLGIGKGCDTNL